MTIEVVLVSTILIATLIAVYTDIKKRYVPNFISYMLIIVGLFGNLMISITNASIFPFAYSLALVFILYALSYVLYRIGYWGGGDAKLLVAYGAVLPVFPEFLKIMLNPVLAPWPFIITLWFNISIFGIILGFLYALYLAVKNRKKFGKEARKILHKYKIGIYVLIFVLISVFVGFLLFKEFAYFLAGIWATVTLIFYLIIFFKAVENSCMYKFVKPSELEEGDWVVNQIEAGEFIYKPRKTGIFQKEIEKLKELEKKGKLKKVKVKEGTPFVPSFFFGLIYSLFFGDILFSLVSTIV